MQKQEKQRLQKDSWRPGGKAVIQVDLDEADRALQNAAKSPNTSSHPSTKQMRRTGSKDRVSSHSNLPKPVASARNREMLRNLRDTNEQIHKSQEHSYDVLNRAQRMMNSYDEQKRLMDLQQLQNYTQGLKYRNAMRVNGRREKSIEKHMAKMQLASGMVHQDQTQDYPMYHTDKATHEKAERSIGKRRSTSLARQAPKRG